MGIIINHKKTDSIGVLLRSKCNFIQLVCYLFVTIGLTIYRGRRYYGESNAIYNIYASTYYLYLFGVMQGGFLFFFGKCFRYYRWMVVLRMGDRKRITGKVYRNLLIAASGFVISYNILVLLFICLQNGRVIESIFTCALNTIVLQLLSYILIGQICIASFLKTFRIGFGIVIAMLIHFICAVNFQDLTSYFLAEGTRMDLVHTTRLICLNLFIFIVNFNLIK